MGCASSPLTQSSIWLRKHMSIALSTMPPPSFKPTSSARPSCWIWHGNFGPYQFPEKLIPLTILNALEGKAIAVYGRGENVRDWLYVDDHARALVEVLRNGRPGEKYNIGARSERANIEVVRAICDLVDE